MLTILRTCFVWSLGLLLGSALLLPLHVVHAEANEFITTWKTDNAGVSANDEIQIPTNGAFVYDYNVSWGDGTMDTHVTGTVTHTFSAPGTYQVAVSGTFPGISFVLAGDRHKLLSIDQWGTNAWGFMGGSFFGCDNLQIYATDTPDLSNILDLTYSFRSTNVSSGFENWDVSHVRFFIGMFQDTNFNGDISRWDMSSAVHIGAMFYSDPAFNQDISQWNTSQVANMNGLFFHDSAFQHDVSGWDIRNVTDMGQMFTGVTLPPDVYQRMLVSWSEQAVQPGVTLDAGNSTYCAAHERGVLTSAPNSWMILDGGNVCLRQVEPIPGRSTVAQAVYTFDTSPAIETAYLALTGSYTTTSLTCIDCSMSIDPIRHRVTFSGLRVGEVLSASFAFTESNTLSIGPVIIIDPPAPTGGGAVGMSLPIEPTVSASDQMMGRALSVVVNQDPGLERVTSPRLQLGLNADPKTVKGYVVSLDPTFARDGIFPFSAGTTSTEFMLPNSPGIYTVYVKYYSLSGHYSPLISKVVTLAPSVSEPRGLESVSTSTACLFVIPLSLGDTGSGVTRLQRALMHQGRAIYPEARVTGFFGEATRRAVIRFQELFSKDILSPLGLKRGTGNVRQATNQKLCQLLT